MPAAGEPRDPCALTSPPWWSSWERLSGSGHGASAGQGPLRGPEHSGDVGVQGCYPPSEGERAGRDSRGILGGGGRGKQRLQDISFQGQSFKMATKNPLMVQNLTSEFKLSVFKAQFLGLQAHFLRPKPFWRVQIPLLPVQVSTAVPEAV